MQTRFLGILKETKINLGLRCVSQLDTIRPMDRYEYLKHYFDGIIAAN